MEKVNFTSHGCNMSAQLYKPENFDQNSKYPAIVLCHGFAGFKEVLLPAYAEAFAKAGYVVLNFDYRGFGESEGEKGRLVPKLQIEDIHSAIDYIASLDFVDSNKIGLWGTSYGGANAITAAAQNDLVKCLSVLRAARREYRSALRRCFQSCRDRPRPFRLPREHWR